MRKFIFTGAVVLMTSTGSAQEAPLPETQWTPYTHLWLARAMVAEAGWNAKLDYVAIAYVLARRWRQMVERWPELRFIDVVKSYCLGLGDYRRQPTERQRWIRSLSWDGSIPESWPRRISWSKHLRFWRTTLAISGRWGKGKFRDPCRGRAWHWGGTIDTPHGRMVVVDCGQTRNTFYGLVPKKNAERAD